MANDAHEEFWGCTITKDRKDFLWDPLAESEEDVEHKLQLTSACLGHKAKNGERNLLEVTTEDEDGKKITCSLVSLRVGGQECIHLDNGFFNSTKFTLKEGSGPVSLCGVHLRALPLDFDENADSSEDEEVPDLVPAEQPKKEKKESAKPAETNKTEKNIDEKKIASPLKRPLAADKKNEKPAKKPKVVELPEDDSGEDSEDEDDEDESGEEESMLDDQAIEDSDEDSEEGDDEPEEGDDIESDDEDEEMDSEDDEDESDEEEEEEKPAKKPTVNGHATKSTPGKGGPQKNKTAEVKTPNAKKTPAKKDTTTTTPKSQAKKTPEELKAFLLKSPNLPKKFDKFANFMKNNMKVVDEKSQKEFWDYVQKNKK